MKDYKEYLHDLYLKGKAGIFGVGDHREFFFHDIGLDYQELRKMFEADPDQCEIPEKVEELPEESKPKAKAKAKAKPKVKKS